MKKKTIDPNETTRPENILRDPPQEYVLFIGYDEGFFMRFKNSKGEIRYTGIFERDGCESTSSLEDTFFAYKDKIIECY